MSGKVGAHGRCCWTEEHTVFSTARKCHTILIYIIIYMVCHYQLTEHSIENKGHIKSSKRVYLTSDIIDRRVVKFCRPAAPQWL